MSDFETKLNEFVNGCQALVNAQYADSPLGTPVLSQSKGRRYVRIVRDDGVQKSVYCFVDKTNGNVLKAAGWSAPAKGARGNVYKDDNGLSRMSPYGAGYNR